jgi:hypothetical protein
MTFIGYTIFTMLIILSPFISHANDHVPSVCAMVSSEQLAALYPSTLYSSQQENGCRWSTTPNGKAYFQIGVVESPNNLRQFFEKNIPSNYQLKKTSDIGDRGLFTEYRGNLSVIAIREGSWVLISTVDLLYIKMEDARQHLLWEIYREILQSLE